MFKHILIPTDGSPTAQKAVKAGLRFAREIGAKVTAYHALDHPLTHINNEGYTIDPTLRDQFAREARKAAQGRLDAIGKVATAAGVVFHSELAEADTPYKGIVDAARKHRCDVIFMASHGRRGVTGLLMGSVTHQVLTHCTTPVLVYR
ncbi:MAG: universal stress protein [Vicinamibacterales bacterium]